MKKLSVLTAIVALAWSVPAGAAGRTSFETAGTCTEIAVVVPIDAAVAREHVPAEFGLTEVAGKAELLVFSERCSIGVDGYKRTTSVIGGAGILTDSNASPAGCGAYALFWTNSRLDRYLRAYRDLAWSMPLDREGGFATTTTGPSILAAAHNRNDIASWDLSLAGATGSTPQIDFDSVHCTVGPRGLVRGGPFHHHAFGLGALAGTLQVEPGSVLWTLLGEREIVSAPGAYFEFSFDGTTALVP